MSGGRHERRPDTRSRRGRSGRGTTPDPAARVLGWRIEQLIAVGFDSDAALVLALDRTVDLHEATELVRRGCPPQTAFRILI